MHATLMLKRAVKAVEEVQLLEVPDSEPSLGPKDKVHWRLQRITFINVKNTHSCVPERSDDIILKPKHSRFTKQKKQRRALRF